jgi:hypothetical protein
MPIVADDMVVVASLARATIKNPVASVRVGTRHAG